MRFNADCNSNFDKDNEIIRTAANLVKETTLFISGHFNNMEESPGFCKLIMQYCMCAIRFGEASAAYILGYLSFHGYGVTPNREKAAMWVKLGFLFGDEKCKALINDKKDIGGFMKDFPATNPNYVEVTKEACFLFTSLKAQMRPHSLIKHISDEDFYNTDQFFDDINQKYEESLVGENYDFFSNTSSGGISCAIQ